MPSQKPREPQHAIASTIVITVNIFMAIGVQAVMRLSADPAPRHESRQPCGSAPTRCHATPRHESRRKAVDQTLCQSGQGSSQGRTAAMAATNQCVMPQDGNTPNCNWVYSPSYLSRHAGRDLHHGIRTANAGYSISLLPQTCEA